MGDKSKISWTDATWNPTTGCHKVSEGCRNCYAAQLAPRLAAMGQTHAYTDLPWTKQNAAENVKLHEDRLEMPLRWKKPRRVFVNSMSDLFHELVPFEFVDRVFAVMALAPRHTFQVLTKRPERMAEYLTGEHHGTTARQRVELAMDALLLEKAGLGTFLGEWPLPNVWLGTSVEDQRAADERIPHLLRTPAAVRFLSCEPLIGPVDLLGDVETPGPAVSVEGYSYPTDYGTGIEYDAALHVGVDWVIAGGESGPNHRPLDHAWIRSLRDQCAAAGVAFWAKQDSGPRSEIELPEDLRVRQMPEATGAAS